jgi:serine/threonine protein kinase
MTEPAGSLRELPPGYTVGPWRVTGLIRHGAWGSVYAARNAEGREVALKALPVGGVSRGQSEMLQDMAGREMEFSMRIDRHPHLLRTLAVRTLSEPGDAFLDGAIVLVLERAVESLKDLMKRAPEGRPVPGYAAFLAQICEAVAHLHARGWVHGDLKPGNVLLMRDGSACVADFGMTAQLEGTHAYTPRIGSPDYLPPEWWTERVSERGVPVRTTADIWAFGVLAHQLLAGGLYPFPGTVHQARVSASQAYANGTAPLHLDERIPAPWQSLIADCLAPDHRTRLVHDAASVLERIRLLP